MLRRGNPTAHRKVTPMRAQAFLFDLDNTLYPAHAGVTEALEDRMNAYVQQVSGLPHPEAVALRQHYFVTYGTTLRGLQLHHEVDIETYLHTVHDFDIPHFVKPNPALVELMETISVPMAIFTNSPREHAERAIDALGLTHLKMPIIDIRMINFLPKPHLSAYQIALQTIDCPAAGTVFFEDTLHNLGRAKSLGMTTVYIPHQFGTPVPDYVDYCFPDALSAITAFL
jgi:putative hydrolase of the HAD superfamily